MKMPPHRIAVVALVAALVVGGGVWWWQNGAAEQRARASIETPVASAMSRTEASKASRRPGAATDKGKPDPALMAAMKQCGMELRDAFNARALQLKDARDGSSQLAYALAVPLAPSMNWEALPPDARHRAIEQRQDEAEWATRKAATLAVGDPDVLWLVAHTCSGGEECKGARQALLKVEPDNMLVWLREMAWAQARGDSAAAVRAFQHAADAPVYDSHAGAIQRVMQKAYGQVSLPAACVEEGVQEAMQRGMGIDLGRPFGAVDNAMWLAAINAPMPTFRTLGEHCPADADLDSARLMACRRILARLAEGDTWLERMVALNRLIPLLGDDPEAMVWRERYRETRWMMLQQGDEEVMALLQPEDSWNDEVRSLQTALQVAGRWPPPADWLPDEENSRSLILTGRPPPERQREKTRAR